MKTPLAGRQETGPWAGAGWRRGAAAAALPAAPRPPATLPEHRGTELFKCATGSPKEGIWPREESVQGTEMEGALAGLRLAHTPTATFFRSFLSLSSAACRANGCTWDRHLGGPSSRCPPTRAPSLIEGVVSGAGGPSRRRAGSFRLLDRRRHIVAAGQPWGTPCTPESFWHVPAMPRGEVWRGGHPPAVPAPRLGRRRRPPPHSGCWDPQS